MTGSGRRTSLKRLLPWLAVVAALLVTAACDRASQPPGNSMSDNPYEQFRELMGRPDIEQVARRYDEMRATIREQLVSEVGLPPLKEDIGSGGSSGCRDFPAIQGGDDETRTLPRWSVEANLPDEKWPRAVQIVDEIARSYGFETPPRVIIDRPGDHEITTTDTYGADLVLGTKATTILTVRTGCHLTVEAHKRGKPAGGP